MGNIKGLQDRYRTPLTQRAFAEKWGQKPEMVTAFADGSKVNFEQAIVANAVGMTVARRGMLGYDHPAHIDALTTRYDLDQLRAARRHRRVRGRRAARPGHLLPGGAARRAPAALPEPVQAGRGPALLVLHAVSPVPLRGAHQRGARGAVRRFRRRAAGRAARRGVRRGQAGSARRRGAGQLRPLHDLWRGRGRGRAPRGPLSARRPGGRVPPGAGRGEGRGRHLRRRGATAGPRRRPAIRRAEPAFC